MIIYEYNKEYVTQYGWLYIPAKKGGVMMGKTVLHRAFLSFALLAFACLLLHGGSRLVASPQIENKPIAVAESWLCASIGCLPSVPRESVHEGKTEDRRVSSQAMVCFGEDEQRISLPVTDANGNILRHVSYVRAVYQAFVLDDGFA